MQREPREIEQLESLWPPTPQHVVLRFRRLSLQAAAATAPFATPDGLTDRAVRRCGSYAAGHPPTPRLSAPPDASKVTFASDYRRFKF